VGGNVEFNVITLEEAAEIMRVTKEQMKMELETGGIPGFQIAGVWRTTKEALWEKIQGRVPTVKSAGSSVPQGIVPISGIKLEWERVGDFTWKAPKSEEHYTEGYKTELTLGNRPVPLVIGYTVRPAYGSDRARVSVLWGHPGGALYAVVEFVGTDDYETKGKVASIIRKGNNKHLRPGEPMPAGYENMPTGIFNECVTGAYSPGCVALIVDKDARDLMVQHAILRSKDKGWSWV